jgi:hypothetical protein
MSVYEISGSPRGSPRQTPIQDPSAFAVDDVAQNHFSSLLSPLSAHLVSAVVECKRTYPEGSDERNQAALDAKKDANEVPSFNNQVESQTEDRTRHFPLINEFYDKMKEGVPLEADQTREIYTQALQLIEGREELDFLLARAFGTVSLASTYDPGANRAAYSEIARDITFAVYERKEELFTNEKSKLSALNIFTQLFKKLIQLFPAGSFLRIAIKKKLAECEIELAILKGPALENKEPSPANSPRVAPKVTKQPFGYLKAARLVLAFTFAAAFITGAFVLGRRYIYLSK